MTTRSPLIDPRPGDIVRAKDGYADDPVLCDQCSNPAAIMIATPSGGNLFRCVPHFCQREITVPMGFIVNHEIWESQRRKNEAVVVEVGR